jgi:hypothetical protein
MSKRIWQTPNPLPLLHRLEPIREGLACCRKIPDSRLLEQRQIGHIGLKPERLIYVIAQPMGLLARFKTDPPIKPP